MRYINGQNRHQLMYISYDAMIGPDNPVRLIDLICRKFYSDNPNLRVNYKNEKTTGRKAYDPVQLMGLLVYGYFNSIPSSRKMEKATHRNIELIWLMKELRPDHWTICAFRRNNKEAFSKLIKMFRLFLVNKKYADGEYIVIDGSKIKAYASRTMLKQKGIEESLQNVDKSIDEFTDRVEKMDLNDESLKKSKLEIANAKKELLELKSTIKKLLKKKLKLNIAKETIKRSEEQYLAPNDPDAVLVKGRDGKFAGYNVQSAVDEKGHFILSTAVSTLKTDQNLLNKNIDGIVEQLDQLPKEITADKGYGNMSEILSAEKRGVKCFIPKPLTKREKLEEENIKFTYNHNSDTYTCSNGKTLVLQSRNQKMRSGELYNQYKCHQCDGCPLRAKCTTSKTGRTLKRKHIEKQVQQYQKSIETKYAKEKIRKRKQIVEHPFGTIKMLMGKFNFLLTKKHKVEIEVDIYSFVYNLKRLLNIEPAAQLSKKVMGFNWKVS